MSGAPPGGNFHVTLVDVKLSVGLEGTDSIYVGPGVFTGGGSAIKATSGTTASDSISRIGIGKIDTRNRTDVDITNINA